MKKYISYLGVLVLACFSFFYTDKAVDIIRRNDPIMKEIISNSESLSVSAVDPIIENDDQIVGLNGKKVNINKSYSNMKKVNQYVESLLVFDEIIPSVKVDYSKYIIKGNEKKNQVALVFTIDSDTYLKELVSILDSRMINATLFIDGKVIEDNLDYISKNLNNYEIENLGYNGVYHDIKIRWTNNMIESFTNNDVKYCYTEYNNSTVLDLCSKNKLYTVKPTFIVNSYPLLTVKKKIESGSIISLNLNREVLKEVSSIVTYIKQKGYEIVDLSILLSQNIVNEK